MDDISVKIVIAVCVLLILVIAKIVYDEKKYIEKLTNRLKKTWGMPTRQEYTENIWKNIKYYHNNQASENDIDDITWNDLEMDRVYEKLNYMRTLFMRNIYMHCFIKHVLTKKNYLRGRDLST